MADAAARLAAVTGLGSGSAFESLTECSYEYRDAQGRPHSRKVRLPGKRFFMQRWKDGCWINGGPREKIPYNLPELEAEPKRIVLSLEGEKDCESATHHGFLATTNIDGAGKCSESYAEALRGHPVVIIPDNDTRGRKHALLVAESLLKVAGRVRVVELPGIGDLGNKRDLTDWFEDGHTAEELKQVILAVQPLTQETLEALKSAWNLVDDSQTSTTRTPKLLLEPIGKLLTEPDEATEWLVKDLLPSGGVSILAAKPKVGKSTTARSLAKNVARGEAFLGRETQAGPVFYLGLEEKRAEVKKHFRTMGVSEDDDIYVFIAPSPADGLAQLQNEIEEKKPALVIIDPLFRFVRVRDGNDYTAVTAALEPILVLARDSGAHLLLTHHATKARAAGGDSILGSTAIFGAVDCALIMKRSERYRTISSIQRYGVDLEETVVELDPETLCVTPAGRKAEADKTHSGNAIFKFLEQQAQPIEEAEIHKQVEGRKNVKVAALRDLVKAEKVARSGSGKKGDPYLYSIWVRLF